MICFTRHALEIREIWIFDRIGTQKWQLQRQIERHSPEICDLCQLRIQIYKRKTQHHCTGRGTTWVRPSIIACCLTGSQSPIIQSSDPE